MKYDPANSTHPDRPHNHDVHTTSHIRTDIIQTRVDTFRIGGGFGMTIGQKVDQFLSDALDKGQRVAALSIVITEDDWNMLETTIRGDEVSPKFD